MKLLIILSILFSAQVSFSKNLIRVKAIGKSSKGQYIAFEEYGFTNNSKTPFSKIRVMNVWKNKYVTKEIKVIGPSKNSNLKEVRAKAKKLAKKGLKSFNISS
jgi:predicted secreted protein